MCLCLSLYMRMCMWLLILLLTVAILSKEKTSVLCTGFPSRFLAHCLQSKHPREKPKTLLGGLEEAKLGELVAF